MLFWTTVASGFYGVVVLLIEFVLLVLFQAISGWNDGGNLRGLYDNSGARPRVLFLLLIAGMAGGPFILGTNVAHTIGNNIIHVEAGDLRVVGAGLLATIGTLVLSWLARVPTSTSLALVGGLLGSAGHALGLRAILWHGVWTTVLSLVLSLVLGFGAGEILYQIERPMRHSLQDRWYTLWRRITYPLTFVQGLAYGANDAEKAIGLGATLLRIQHPAAGFQVSFLLVGACTVIWLVGALLGGKRIAATIGHEFYQLKPKHVAAIQTTATLVVMGAAAVGGPVSTTQTIDSALLGVGRDLRHQRVNRQTAIRMFTAWGLTLPVSAVLGIVASSLYH